MSPGSTASEYSLFTGMNADDVDGPCMKRSMACPYSWTSTSGLEMFTRMSLSLLLNCPMKSVLENLLTLRWMSAHAGGLGSTPAVSSSLMFSAKDLTCAEETLRSTSRPVKNLFSPVSFRRFAPRTSERMSQYGRIEAGTSLRSPLARQ